MQDPQATQRFVQEMTRCQNRIFGYIVSLIGSLEDAHDVLQNTNLVLWEKAADYDASRDFIAWSFGIARMQCLAHVRDRRRDKLRFSDAMIERIGQAVAERAPEHDARRTALHECMDALPPQQAELIQNRYRAGSSVQHLAEQLDRPVGSVSQSLYRIRQLLADCVQQKMEQDA